MVIIENSSSTSDKENEGKKVKIMYRVLVLYLISTDNKKEAEHG